MMTKVTLLGIPAGGERGANLRHDAGSRAYYIGGDDGRNHLDYLLRASSQDLDWDGARTPPRPFGPDGRLLTDDDIRRMRADAAGDPPVWYGTISAYGADAPRMTRDRWRSLTARVMGDFLVRAGLDPGNVDMICVAHTRHRDDGHMHIVFWEKERTRDRPRGRKAYTPAKDVCGMKGELEALADGYLRDPASFRSCSEEDMLRSVAAAARDRRLCGEEEIYRALGEAADNHLGEKRESVLVSKEEAAAVSSALYMYDEGVREKTDGLEFMIARAKRGAEARLDNAAQDELERERGEFETERAALFRDAVFGFAASVPRVAATDAEGKEIPTKRRFQDYWKCSREGRAERRKICSRLAEGYAREVGRLAEATAVKVMVTDEKSRGRKARWIEEEAERLSPASDAVKARPGTEKDMDIGGKCR